MQIKVVPLGAGQDVGKSCVLVTIGGKNIMMDCGMHPGYNDSRRFPDFRYISREGNFNGLIDLVIISHFHLDHCGSLPYFTEVLGYDGPLYATHPTKAIMPILLEDYRKISVERRGVEQKDFFTSEQIKQCMLKVTPCALEETVTIEPDFEIRPYYAGHVLGAAMFYIRVGQQSLLYTGDYNMTPDRHLGSARCDKLRPDLMITESTYATTIRESKRWRERDLLDQVTQTVRAGGKVLIPVFALGRAQELCLLLDAHWERTGLDVPIYFSAGLTEKANWYYKLYISWTNQKIKDTFVKRNVFDFQHIRPFDRALIEQQASPHARMHTRTHTRTHAHARAYSRTLAHTQSLTAHLWCGAGPNGAVCNAWHAARRALDGGVQKMGAVREQLGHHARLLRRRHPRPQGAAPLLIRY